MDFNKIEIIKKKAQIPPETTEFAEDAQPEFKADIVLEEDDTVETAEEWIEQEAQGRMNISNEPADPSVGLNEGFFVNESEFTVDVTDFPYDPDEISSFSYTYEYTPAPKRRGFRLIERSPVEIDYYVRKDREYNMNGRIIWVYKVEDF